MFRGEVESRKIYEDGDNIAVLDINPRMHECQVLVIPRTHVEQFYELDDKELASLFRAVKEVALMIRRAYNPDFVCLEKRRHTHGIHAEPNKHSLQRGRPAPNP